jgi:hypothetical protein
MPLPPIDCQGKKWWGPSRNSGTYLPYIGDACPSYGDYGDYTRYGRVCRLDALPKKLTCPALAFYYLSMLVPVSMIQFRRDEDGVWIARFTPLPGCHAHGADGGEAILAFEEATKATRERTSKFAGRLRRDLRERFSSSPH